MKKLGILASFMVGCAVLFSAFVIGWSDWGKLANRIGIMQILMGALGILVILLMVMGILSKGRERWTSLTLGAILLLGFSALLFFSVGWLIAPAALLLLGLSIWKLLHRRTELNAF